MKRSLGNSEHPEIPQSVFDVFDVKASGGVSEHLGLHVSNLGEGMTGWQAANEHGNDGAQVKVVRWTDQMK